MKRLITIWTLTVLIFSNSCEEILEPQPVSLLIDNLALNEAADVQSVRIGLYNAFRGIASPKVLAGDFMADVLVHNGTFSQYREFSNKEVTASNGTVTALWGGIYGSVYVANFILEKLPAIEGVDPELRTRVTAEARFIRGYAYFIATTSFGDVPWVTTTDITVNRSISRTPFNEIEGFVEEDLLYALNNLPSEVINPGYASSFAARAALARYYLYRGNWTEAEFFATEIIEMGEYELTENYSDIVFNDFTDEAILEVGYTTADDPGTSSTGLNNLFRGRREIIPSNQAVFNLSSDASGDRFSVISFNSENLGGSDNGWSVAKYGTADEDNNNIIVYRLGEIYLIRAEARARQNNLSGAQSDVNVLRQRANAPTVVLSSIPQAEELIERERYFELAYEGHRWYDLVRTNRANTVMGSYSPNWKETFDLLPIPLREIQNNPALAGQQNPGY